MIPVSSSAQNTGRPAGGTAVVDLAEADEAPQARAVLERVLGDGALFVDGGRLNAPLADADVAIWTLRMEPGAHWTLPAARGQGTHRMLYWFVGEGLSIAGEPQGGHAALEVAADRALELVNTGGDTVECLLLQGRPIGEPVVQYGPFVMNTTGEIQQAVADFQRGALAS